MELKIPGVLLAGRVDEERARFAGRHEGDVCAHVAGLENGVAGWIFFRGEYLLQLVELGRAEVAVLLQEANEGVHTFYQFMKPELEMKAGFCKHQKRISDSLVEKNRVTKSC